ncbi:plakophilin-2-like isoform X1 [Acipenser ruthenus]|uniref:plakophilin-2-like isoform X1 n=2 Tax=Acipenser ruthenus TaxID=7906 RepID=UPI00145AEB37|nr:plakophilin-2-like isoform X1 [Acipenser ruthenus]
MATTESNSDGFIKTVLPLDGFHVGLFDDTSLALPPEESIKLSNRQINEKGFRVQQQVQLTLARKSKSGVSNGSLHQSSSIPEQVYRYDCMSTAHQEPYSTSKFYNTLSNENGCGTPGKSFSGTYVRSENMKRPSMRLKVSPLSSPEMPLSRAQTSYNYEMFHKGLHTLPAVQTPIIQRLSTKSTSMPTRYARSEILNFNRCNTSGRGRYYSSRRPQVWNQGRLDNAVFLDSLRSSPNTIQFQRPGTSQSLTNFVDAGRSAAAMGQTQVQMQNRNLNMGRESQRYSWHHNNVRRDQMFQGNAARASQPPSLSSMQIDGNIRQSKGGMTVAVLSNEGAIERQMQASFSGAQTKAAKGEAIEMTLDKAISYLTASNSEWQVTAATFIQHQCFVNVDSKRMVYFMHGIPKLIKALESDNVELQRAASGALRNIVFEDSHNKMEVNEKNGIPVVLRLLKQTRDVETKKQLTGLLWNLSSIDSLKDILIREALQPVTDAIVVPCSGWSDGDYPKGNLLSDPDLFYNATGCLRNLSSAGLVGRKAMRECESLIDSLVHYVRGTIADYKAGDKATENCVCILHNVSYQLESELPGRYFKDLSSSRRDLFPQDKTPGCFATQSRKIKQKDDHRVPFPEEKSNPHGVEWLWSPIIVRMYLSLIAKSTRSYTQEASMGALQNLTAGNGVISFSIAQTIVQRENGLQHIRRMLHLSESGVKKTAGSLLRNISRYPELHKEMANQVLPDLVSVLPNTAQDLQVPAEMTVSVCYVLNNLVRSDSQNARTILNNEGLRKIINISTNDSNVPTKAGQSASILLHTMWKCSELRSAYKKAGYKKGVFINNRTMGVTQSLKD